MTSTTDYSMFGMINGETGEITTGEEAVPLYMRENGQELCDQRQKELETFLKCLESYPLNAVILKEKTLTFHDGGREYDDWWKTRTSHESFLGFLLDRKNHKVNGKVWNNGFMGSRWADTNINGKFCRLAFYTKKNDSKMFASIPKRLTEGKDYVIIVHPDYIHNPFGF